MADDKKTDRLDDMFDRQRFFMDLLVNNDKFPEYPVDLTSKPGQRLAKEVIFNLSAELHEAAYTLKNSMHRLTDARLYDRDHYLEELGDAWAYFMELLVLSGFTPEELYQEYCRKNQVVIDRFKRGY